MDREKLMIMGAGIYQVPLIKKAKAMGLKTIVVSIPGDYPGIALADVYAPLDTRDKTGVLDLAKREKIAGICTSGTDVAVSTIGYVCSRMDLSGISCEAAALVTDKAAMKEAFVKGNVSTAKYRKVFSYHEALEVAEELGYPVVVKPVDSSGSRGVQKVSRHEDLKTAFETAKKVCVQDYLLVEEYIDAREIGIDGYVGEEGVSIILPHGKDNYTTPRGVTMPAGHRFPYECDQGLLEEIHRQIDLAVKALRLRNCTFNADAFVLDGRVWIIEIGGRTGATCIPELISINKGYDWYEKTIETALGRKPVFFSEENNACMARLLFSPVDSMITKIDQDQLHQLMQEDIVFQLDHGVGERVEAVKNGTDRIGHVIVKTRSEEMLEKYCSRLRSAIWLEVGNLETIWRRENEDRI